MKTSDIIYNYDPLWGNWFINKHIGTGSIGKVYKVKKLEYGKEFFSAVKFISIPSDEQYDTLLRSTDNLTKEQTYEYFENIVQNILLEVEHYYSLRGYTNIVSYEDHMVKKIQAENKWFIFLRMEYLKTFRSYLKSKKLNETDIIKFALDILNGIKVCHDKGIIHRDIKEDNIFVKDGVFKIGDFSVSKNVNDYSINKTKVGTYSYMPPEILKGSNYTKNVDLYSLGIILYKLLNKGRFPFMPQYPKTFNENDVINAHKIRFSGKAFPNPLDGSENLIKIILKSCSFEPDERYQTAEEMIRDIDSSSIINPHNSNYMNLNDVNTINDTLTNDDTEQKTLDIFSVSSPKNINVKLNKKNKLKLALIPIFVIILCIVYFIYSNSPNSNKSNNYSQFKETLKPTYSSNAKNKKTDNKQTTPTSSENIEKKTTNTVENTVSPTVLQSVIPKTIVSAENTDKKYNYVTFKRYFISEIFDHLYSVDDLDIGNNTATYEGTIGKVSMKKIPNTVPLYELNRVGYNHVYVTTENDKQYWISKGYKYIGIECYIYSTKVPNSVPLYMLYHKDKVDHIYEVDDDMRDSKINNHGYEYVGTIGYIINKSFN
ncbi:MAG: serine/threonine-protein kinase [Clostridiales bacterium]